MNKFLLFASLTMMFPADRYISNRDFKNTDYTTMNNNLDNICWGQIYTPGNTNVQLYFSDKFVIDGFSSKPSSPNSNRTIEMSVDYERCAELMISRLLINPQG